MSQPGAFALLVCNMQENWRLSREAEEKRSLVATVNLFLATALNITLAFTGFHRPLLFITCWLIIMGIYGILAGQKLYERSQFHILRARKLRAKLDTLYPEAQLEDLFQLAEKEQKQAYPRLISIRLNTIWTVLHVAILALGVVYSILCLL